MRTDCLHILVFLYNKEFKCVFFPSSFLLSWESLITVKAMESKISDYNLPTMSASCALLLYQARVQQVGLVGEHDGVSVT